MKIWPPARFASLCHTHWERFVLWRIQSDAALLRLTWAVALLATVILFAAGKELRLILAVLAGLCWFGVVQSHISRTLLRLLERAAAGEQEGKCMKEGCELAATAREFRRSSGHWPEDFEELKAFVDQAGYRISDYEQVEFRELEEDAMDLAFIAKDVSGRMTVRLTER